MWYPAHIDWLLRVVVEAAVACALVAHLRAALELYRRGDLRLGREKAFSAAGFGLILIGSLVSAAWLYGPDADMASILMTLPLGFLSPVAITALGFVSLASAAVLGLMNSQTLPLAEKPVKGEGTAWPPPPSV